MTQPVDPADRFLERMRLVSQDEYGTKYRPGFARTLAESDASPGDLVRIGALVRAMDTQRRVRLMAQSGASVSTTGAENDLLDQANAGAEKVQVADYRAPAKSPDDLPWYQDVWNWANNTTIVRLGEPDAAEQHDSALGNVPLIDQALDVLGKTPGFLYREGRDAIVDYDPELRDEQMKLLGYDPGGFWGWDEVAFAWSHGEAFYGDNMTDLKDRYGAEDVALAMQTFRNGTDLRDFQVDLENQYVSAYESGDQRKMQELATRIEKVNGPEFREVYEAVDRRHSSAGRDLARAILPGKWEDDAAFTAISGASDALFTLFVDPTLVGGKVAKSVQVARWGIDSVDTNKIYHMLGETDTLGRAPTKKYYQAENNGRREGVEDLLKRAGEYRTAMAAGKMDEAAGIYAGASKIHKDLMPLWSEINGVRPALTPMERAWAKANGERLVDVNGVEAAGGAFRVKPIESVREFADLAANRWGLMRLQNGLAANPKALMPGQMGFRAAKRADRAMARTKARIGEDDAFNFAASNLDNLIGSEAEDALMKAAEAKGRALFDEAHEWTGIADKIRVKAEAASRRFSTHLKSGKELNYHSAAAAKDVRRFARIFLPKHEAEKFAAMWEHGNAATRRTLGKALVRETFEAAGLSRSTVGREFMEKYVNDLANQSKRRYAFGDADLIEDAYQGPRRAGMYQNQMEEGLALPNFTELKRAAAKAAVLGYDTGLSKFGMNTASLKQLAKGKMGLTATRYMLFSSTFADSFMQAVKLGWITTGSNMLRNALDEYGLLTLTGKRAGLARGRQTMRDAGLHNQLDEGTKRTRAFVALTNHQIPRALRMGIRNLRDATLAINKGKLEMMGKGAEWRVQYAKELHDSTAAEEVAEYLGGRIIDNPDEVLTLGEEVAREMAALGLPAEKWAFKGYDLLPVDGGAGLKALASMFGQRFVGDSPAHGVLAFLMWHYGKRNPEFWKELDADTIARMKRVIFGENDPNPGVSLEAMEPTPEYVRLLLHRAEFSQLRKESEHFNVDEAGNRIDPNDAEALDAAVRRMVPKYLLDIFSAVKGKNGKINGELASMLLRGEIPDVTRLAKMGLDNLPEYAVQPQFALKATGFVNGVLNGYTKAMTRGYDFIVTKPIRALIRTPLYVDAYTTARALTSKYADDLVNKFGWTREIADAEARKLAEKHALNEVIKYVDNPAVSSQFSAMNRNWWSFFRAQEDWLRRYGKAMKADPTMIRKAQLAVYGAEQAGILDRDEEGNLILTYPGSGAIAEAFLHIGGFLGINETALIPDVPDLTTRLTFLNPSLTNPFAYSATPMVSIPYKVIAGLTPGGELLKAGGDRLLNGELGAGRAWYEQLLPTPILRLAQMWDDGENTGSVVGGATATAMVNLALAGDGLDKYSDTPEDRARLIADLQQQSRNVLVTRMVMGFGLPGAPGMPEIGEDGDAVNADFSYQQAGIMSLKEEYRDMLARMGPGAALSLWAEIHPEASVLASTAKTDTAPGARANYTLEQAAFVEANRDFFTGEYKAIAPYFLMEEKGEFSQIAWNALLELEVRQHKDLDEFFVDLVTGRAVSEYYKAQDENEAAIAKARLSGERGEVDRLESEWDQFKVDHAARYPTWDDYQSEGSVRARQRQDRLERLEQLVADPDAPAQIQPQLAGIAQMLQVHRNYEHANGLLKDQRSTRAQAERQNLRVQFHEEMLSIVKKYPTLEDAYNGIFRPLVQE